MSDTIRDLSRETRLVLDRVGGWTGSAWDVPVPSGHSRAARLRLLIDHFALLGREAGSGAPAGVTPPPVADHALPDQLAVLAGDFLDAVGAAATDRRRGQELVRRALREVADARADLDGHGFGFRRTFTPR